MAPPRWSVPPHSIALERFGGRVYNFGRVALSPRLCRCARAQIMRLIVATAELEAAGAEARRKVRLRRGCETPPLGQIAKQSAVRRSLRLEALAG